MNALPYQKVNIVPYHTIKSHCSGLGSRVQATYKLQENKPYKNLKTSWKSKPNKTLAIPLFHPNGFKFEV